MDKITKNLLDGFATDNGLKMSESELFEHFCNYCILASEYAEEFNLEDVLVAGGDDTGLDGIAVIVNGNLILSIDEIDDLCEQNKSLEVAFIFIQAKTSSEFDGGDIGTFAFGVKDFFNDSPKLPRNDKIKEKVSYQERIYQKSSMMRNKPGLKVFYVTTGRWQNPPALVGRIKTEVEDLKQTNLFSDVEFNPVDADGIQKLYNKSKNRVSTEITFANRTVLPDIQDVREAYLGILPVTEYLKLITNDHGFINKNLFFDNVRDFLGDNEVNAEVGQTIRGSSPDRFGILNNGVTVVAQNLKSVGNKFTVEDYQIVNGCQTSHILFENRNVLTESMFLPVRLIHTDNEDVINAVIKGTNRQNSVAIEEFLALSDFNKKLEAFFKSFESPKQLYYERRSKQYNGLPDIEKVRIVSIPMQIRYFASMFLNSPHRAGRHYKSLLDQSKSEIFISNHSLYPYYVSAFTSYRLTSFFRNLSLDSQYRPAKYHILMMARLLSGGVEMPSLHANKMDRYCNKILDVLYDNAQCIALFNRAASIIDSVTEGKFDRDSIRSPQITQKLEKFINSQAKNGAQATL